jgi:PKD repeat protein
MWYNGPTTSSLSNLLQGTYSCQITDANGCITVNNIQVGPYECSANFTLIRDTNIAHHYWAVNYATGTPPIHYRWNWGDSSAFDSSAYPSHIYANPGVYTICLTIWDSVWCQRTYCSSDSIQRTSNTMVYVNVINPATLGIKAVESLNNWSVYPNPVSNSMTINYNLSASTDVMINIYDMLGNKVSSIANEKEVAGQHAITWNAKSIPQGIYIMQVRVDDKVLNQRITVLK